MGRTGKWWAIEHSGVHPDIVCSAKGIASGMPVSVVITKADVMDWVPGSHASTFGGNPVCIAAALATLDVLEREGVKNAAEVGSYMLQRLGTWPQKHAIVGDVRGRGLMLAVEIVKDKESKTPDSEARDRIVEAAFERGVLFLGAGANSIRISPPLIVSREEADVAMDILEECISNAHKH
jgi:4-aminobutyrate aminotransferase